MIDKPSGMVVNRSETTEGERTVQEWAESKLGLKDEGRRTKDFSSALGLQPSAFLSRAGIVHRLDKETSGCLVIAKTPDAFGALQRQFKDRTVEKEYLALVHGFVTPQEGIIRVPLARSRGNRLRFTVSAHGRIAETAYRVDRHYQRAGRPYALLMLAPKTGRTHQIRVHLRYIGHPIVADKTYGGEKRSSEDHIWCPRMFLHAGNISFIHPVKKTRVSVRSPIPLDLQTALSMLS